MFRLYSKGCEYAIRALMCVAPKEKGERFQAKDICEKAGIPEPYTRKIFQALVQAGFLQAVRGPGGGYELTKHPGQISLHDVIRSVDGEDTFNGCVMGLPDCGGDSPCPLHDVWEEALGHLLSRLKSVTLLDLVEISESKKAESK